MIPGILSEVTVTIMLHGEPESTRLSQLRRWLKPINGPFSKNERLVANGWVLINAFRLAELLKCIMLIDGTDHLRIQSKIPSC